MSQIYRHYKNKYYQLRGTARHSETLEELALYDCLYENSLGKTWVRPQELFYGNLNVDGKEMPRFTPVELTVQQHTQLESSQLALIGEMMASIFGEWDPVWFEKTFSKYQKYLLLLTALDGRVVGFKLGYELSTSIFYSWLGGTLPDYRGLGVATQLMAAQHQWCQQNGFTSIQTKSQNRFKPMIQLNLKNGFDIVGTESSPEGFKILFEKKL